MKKSEPATAAIGEREERSELIGEHYLSCLAQFHELLRPRTYLEIGTSRGDSLKLAQCAAIAVGPELQFDCSLPTEIIPALCMFRMSSDEFFKSYDPRSILGAPIDLAFLDGLRLIEYLLRDFIYIEKACHKHSVIVLRDCVPLDLQMAARNINNNKRHNLSAHPLRSTGDVWKVLPILWRYRSDLKIEVFNAQPTGLAVIRQLDSSSRALADHYDEIVEEFRNPKDESALFNEFLSTLEIRDTARLTGPGSLLEGRKFIARLLAKHPPRDFFREGSELREGLLRQAPSEDIVEPLRRAFVRERDQAGIALLYKEAATEGWPVHTTTDDLAFCKPAVTSSVGRFSRHQDPEREACGANGEPLSDDFGFHTRLETNPWWMVDLLNEYVIEEVAIVNRHNMAERFRTFRIETSCDGATWTTRFTQANPRDVSSDPEWPWRVRFTDSFPARYLRVVLLGMGILHLRRVQVFGRTATVSTRFNSNHT